MCAHVSAYVCECTCACMRVSVCVHACKCVCNASVHACLCLCISVCLYSYVCVCLSVCVCVHACTCMRVCGYMLSVWAWAYMHVLSIIIVRTCTHVPVIIWYMCISCNSCCTHSKYNPLYYVVSNYHNIDCLLPI